MGDIKWIKLSTNMHDDEKIKLIDAMPERDTVHYIWIRLLVQAGKNNANGLIYLKENISYTDEMLATIFGRPIASIRLALKVLSDFEMIEIDSNNVIRIINWEKHQNIEGMDRVREQNRKRVQTHRERKKQLESADEENSTKIEENECNVAKKSCNVTENESNATVTKQNKRESKNKKENKNENKKESESKNICDEISSHSENEEIKNSNSTHSQNKINSINFEETYVEASKLLKEYENITGIANVLNIGAIKLAISMHGVKHVKMAINRALEVNKPDMNYINGILKNWRREGYPKDMGVNKNGVKSFGKDVGEDKEQFAGFKPRKPRNLTEDQRKRAEEKLI